MQQCGRSTGEWQSSVSRRRRCPRWPAWPRPRTTGAAGGQRYGLAVPDEDRRRGVFSATSAPQDQAELEHHRRQRRAPRPERQGDVGRRRPRGEADGGFAPILGAHPSRIRINCSGNAPAALWHSTAAVLRARCHSDASRPRRAFGQGAAAAAASAVVAETAPDWPGGLCPSTAVSSLQAERAASLAHGTTRLARYARATPALLLARLSVSP